MVDHWSSMMHNRGRMVDHWSSMMHNRGRMVDHWSSMVDHWSSMMDHWSSVMHNRGSVVHNRSMVNQRCSMHRCLIIVGLSSISHFLDHPVPTIVVSHSLHPTIRQGNSVGARGGVAIPGLLLLEVCSAVAIVDTVLVGVDGGLAQVLVGELRCWRSQARADKGQQQGHLEGDEGGVAGGNGRWEIMLWKKSGKGTIIFKGKGIKDWVDNKI